MARSTKLTPDIQQRIAADIRLGLPMRIAAAGVDVDEVTVWRWMRADRAPYRQFRKAIDLARRDRAVMLLATVVKATREQRDKNNKLIREGDPNVALKLLEKVEPSDFGARVRVHVEAELDAAIVRLTEEFKNEPPLLERALMAIAGGEGGRKTGNAAHLEDL